MQRKTLALFPQSKSSRKKNKTSDALKEKENVLQVLAAGVVKLSTNEQKDPNVNLAGCQISDIRGLFADSDLQQYRITDKTSLRKCLEKRYEDAFLTPTISLSVCVRVRDGMQDIFLSPLKHHLTFKDYFRLFWEVKIKRCFSGSSTVIIDFDKQRRTKLVPKDNLHVIRDDKSGTICIDVTVNDDAVVPVGKSSWGYFLANRNNKASLVEYLCEKMKVENSSLMEHEKLLMSFEGYVFQVTKECTIEVTSLQNNHIESDTRMFFLLANVDIQKPVWVIRSTDTDILFTALLNHDHLSLDARKVYINYNKNGDATKYCCLNDLDDCINGDASFSLVTTRMMSAAKFVGLLHFVSGCDDLSFLRGFTKNLCFKAFDKHSYKICPETPESAEELFFGDQLATEDFMVRYISCLYFYKFSSSFKPGETSSLLIDLGKKELLDMIRKRTWHKTISSNKTLPSLSAIRLHVQRLAYILSSIGNASLPYHRDLEPTDYGWRIISNSKGLSIAPKWDSIDSINEINLIRKAFLSKCGCQKSLCLKNSCSCRKANKLCTNLCSCVDCHNSENQSTEKEKAADEPEEDEEDEEDKDEDDESDIESNDGYEEVGDDVGEEGEEDNDDDIFIV